MTVSDRKEQSIYLPYWFSLLSGPLIWSLHFIVVYLLVEFSCQAGVFLTQWMGLRWVTVLVIVATVIALGAVIISGLYALRTFRGESDRDSNGSEDSLDRSPARFMSLSGVFLNFLFAFLIILMAVPAITLAPCVR